MLYRQHLNNQYQEQ